jgi:hypothetical protein
MPWGIFEHSGALMSADSCRVVGVRSLFSTLASLLPDQELALELFHLNLPSRVINLDHRMLARKRTCEG